jgi:NAD(P)-dependent dehydrogenase (short-subunit alcohol dehydrogenase family)
MNKQFQNNSPFDGQAVLITGCSSGIGKHSAIALAKDGLLVFTTVRKETDAAKLRNLNLPNLIPVCPLDLTNLEHIANAARMVSNELKRRGKTGLHALINSAGGGSPSPVELMDLDKFRRELQTRLLGSVAMVQSFLPMIRQASGRIIWIMTPAMVPTPYVTSIHACDFAVNCIARTLDIELKRWNIPNIMVKCGGIKTPAGLRTTEDVEAVLQKGPFERTGLYKDALRKGHGEFRSKTDRS